VKHSWTLAKEAGRFYEVICLGFTNNSLVDIVLFQRGEDFSSSIPSFV
jgi:hypothetical protein